MKDYDKVNLLRMEYVTNTVCCAAADEIESLRQQLADKDKQIAMLHFGLFTSANYIDTLGGTSIEARRTLADTEKP